MNQESTFILRFISVTPLGLDLRAHPVYLRWEETRKIFARYLFSEDVTTKSFIYFISTSLSCNSKLILLFADFCWFSNFSTRSPQQEFCPSWFSQSSTSEYTKGPDKWAYINLNKLHNSGTESLLTVSLWCTRRRRTSPRSWSPWSSCSSSSTCPAWWWACTRYHGEHTLTLTSSRHPLSWVLLRHFG